MNSSIHESVLKNEVIDLLSIRPESQVIDATLGGGGHAEAILQIIRDKGKLWGIDQDAEAIKRARERLSHYQDRIIFIEANFRDLDQIIQNHSIPKLDAVLFDLGFSSDQVLNPSRGFSFMLDAPLDMRMSLKSDITAADLLNTLSERELADVFWKFGEEKKSRRIAKAVIEERKKNRITTTKQLAILVSDALGGRHGKTHPATKVFQALRILVNDELEAAKEGISKGIEALKEGGRAGVISFHSLEDRLVKQLFKHLEANGKIRILTKKVVKPGREECLRNPKARSAKLRVAEKTGCGEVDNRNDS